ncbi:MAG: hypothetical protein QOI56_702, partial [Actinomycetota bacterium]|nr:hypothetical protein [Actinomycetota bacterium]
MPDRAPDGNGGGGLGVRPDGRGGLGLDAGLGVRLVGDDLTAPCIDGLERPYLSLDAAASTSALPAVAQRVADFLPRYSSVHRGAGWRSQLATSDYEQARAA